MAIQDILTNIFKSAYPDKSDDEIGAQVNGLMQAPHDALHSALSAIPGLGLGNALADAAPDAANSIGNSVANSHTVQEGAKTLLSGEEGNPISSLSKGLSEGAAKDLFEPSSLPEKDTEGPGPTPEDLAAPTMEPTPPPTGDVTPAKDTATGSNSAKAGSKSGADALLPSQEKMDQDNESRLAMLKGEHDKRKLGALASFGAGVGDAITNASSAFGGNAHSDKQAGVEKTLNENETRNKAEFEEKLKNDPNSDVSKHYQKVLGLMMGKHPDDPSLTHMSAATIAQTLPEIEKYMAKELGVQQIKSNKELQHSMMDRNEQDRLYQQGLQSINSARGEHQIQQVEGQRDAAISAFNRLRELKAAGTAPNPVDYADILGQIYKARTGAAPTNEIMKEIHQDTAKGSMGKWYTYATGKQVPATTEDIANSLMTMAQSMGQQADKLHEGWMNSRGANALSPRLNPEDKERLSKMSRGMSFAEATGAQAQPAPKATAAEGTTKSIQGRNFVVMNGQWHEVK